MKKKLLICAMGLTGSALGFAPPMLIGQNRALVARGAVVSSLQRHVRPRAMQEQVRMMTTTEPAATGEVDIKRIATYFGATGAEVLFLTAAMAGKPAGLVAFSRAGTYAEIDAQVYRLSEATCLLSATSFWRASSSLPCLSR
jgi:hypothetical protein